MRTLVFLAVSLLPITQQVANASDDLCGTENTSFASYDALGTLVTTRVFFESIKGNYKILKAGGQEPHANEVGLVELESGQSVLTFGFCPPSGGCDPGYNFFDDVKTKVYQMPIPEGGAVFTILSDDGGKATKFTWSIKSDGIVSLKNFQYVMPGGSVVVLEHLAKKI